MEEIEMQHVGVKPTALKTMLEHGRSQLDKGFEVGGVITGRKENGSVLITDAIPLSVGQRTTVEITPELFAEAYKEKQERRIEDPIVGWYHSHPGYSCFMSDTDKSAHKRMLNLYKDSIAFVIDPVMYVEGKPSSEFFKVFTLSDGEVVEIPSDIDGSQKSKEEMFRGFVSGKETVIERVIMKPPQGRPWNQIASVVLLTLILLLNMYGISKVEEVGNSVLEGGNFYSMVERIENQFDSQGDGILTRIRDGIYLGQENRIENIQSTLDGVKQKVDEMEPQQKPSIKFYVDNKPLEPKSPTSTFLRKIPSGESLIRFRAEPIEGGEFRIKWSSDIADKVSITVDGEEIPNGYSFEDKIEICINLEDTNLSEIRITIVDVQSNTEYILTFVKEP
jgi:proteasome lid subunit RPN8/RPN11